MLAINLEAHQYYAYPFKEIKYSIVILLSHRCIEIFEILLETKNNYSILR